MRAHVLAEDGTILNTIVVGSLDFLPNLIDASLGGGIGDRVESGVIIHQQRFDPVPQSITPFQAKAAILNNGLMPAVTTLMADPSTPAITSLAWEEASEFRRDSPTISAMAAALGLNDAQIDQMFIDGAKITA